MSQFRLTVNTQQLLDVLIIAITDNAKDGEVITVEEVYDIIGDFKNLVWDHIDADQSFRGNERYDPIISKPDADLDDD